jgi:hypothetical protein
MGSPPPETRAVVAENARWGLSIELACAKPQRLWRLFRPEGFFDPRRRELSVRSKG